MHNRAVTCTDNVFVFQDGELGFKDLDRVYGTIRRSQHEARGDIFILYPTKPDANVITTERVRDFFLHLVGDTRNFDSHLFTAVNSIVPAHDRRP